MDLEALKTEMQRKSIEQNTARLNISQARERMEEEAESAQSLKLEEQEIETRIFEIRSGKESITQELAASEELEKTTQEQILGFQKELESCRLEESEASAHAGEWEVKVEKMRQALDYKQANVDRIGGELERAQAELNEILEALTEMRRKWNARRTTSWRLRRPSRLLTRIRMLPGRSWTKTLRKRKNCLQNRKISSAAEKKCPSV